MQGKDLNNFNVLGFFNEMFEKKSYTELVKFLEMCYAEIHGVKEYKIEQSQKTKKRKIDQES